MQRVKFTNASPEAAPLANFYILKADELSTLPTNCFTLYATTDVKSEALSKISPDGLAVLYQAKHELAGFEPKQMLFKKFQTAQTELTTWLGTHGIVLSELEDLEKSNEALDTLLSSTRLQTEFLQRTLMLNHLYALNQPLTLPDVESSIFETVQFLELQVKSLSPSFLSDHIVDSSSEDSFLLRDAKRYSNATWDIGALKEFVSLQYKLGRDSLAQAIELKAGIVRI
jgi:hypothetical protein